MGQKIGAEVRLVEKLINLPSGGSVQVRSADDPNSLRGDGLDLVVMDENAFIKEAAWVEALRRESFIHQHPQGSQLVLAVVGPGTGRWQR
jgi:phage terminase large subunit-like protein